MRGVLFEADGIELRGTVDGIRFSVTDEGTDGVSHGYISYENLLEMKKVIDRILENTPPIVHICGGGLEDGL